MTSELEYSSFIFDWLFEFCFQMLNGHDIFFMRGMFRLPSTAALALRRDTYMILH